MWWLIGTLMAMPTKDLERTMCAVKRVQRRRLTERLSWLVTR